MKADILIKDCAIVWGSNYPCIALNPHQVIFDNINSFILQLCVSYYLLIGITIRFEFTISKTVLMILSIHIILYRWPLWIQGVSIARLVFARVIKQMLGFPILVERKICLSDLTMFQLLHNFDEEIERRMTRFIQWYKYISYNIQSYFYYCL